MSDNLAQWATDDDSTAVEDESSDDNPSKTYPIFWENKHPVAYSLCKEKSILREGPKDTNHRNIGGWFDALIQGVMPLMGEFEDGYEWPSETRFPLKYIPNLVEAASEALVEAHYENNYEPLLTLVEPTEKDDGTGDPAEFYRQLAEFVDERTDD